MIISGNDKQKDKEQAEKPELSLDKQYTTFLIDLKENVVDYGSIIKSLKSGEQLIFKLNFPNCRKCTEMPKRLEVSAKKTTLDAYRKDQISLEKAIDQLVIK